MEMQYRSEPRSRPGISSYLEVFVLIGLATAGTAIVFATVTRYGGMSNGPSISVENAEISQGSNEALVSMVLSNTGTTPSPSFTLTIPGIAGAQFYVSLMNLAKGSTVAASPSSGTAPSSITENVAIPPGQALVLSLTIMGGAEFTTGSSYTIVVSSLSGALTELRVTATTV